MLSNRLILCRPILLPSILLSSFQKFLTMTCNSALDQRTYVIWRLRQILTGSEEEGTPAWSLEAEEREKPPCLSLIHR